MRADIIICLSVVGLCFLGACSRTDPSGGRDGLRDLNVVLITVDTLRADHVSAYGARARTPHVDRLALEGVVFERCIAQTPMTLPAHATILSGTYPLQHRVRDNGGVVPDAVELVSETLREEGYVTSAFVAAYVLHSKWGLDQGFNVYSDAFDRARYERLRLQNEKRAEEVIGRAKDWLRSHKESRFFTWIHLFDPHAPYEPPAPFDKYPEDPYRGEVEYTDHALGELFSFLQAEGLYDNSLIVFTGDHGESLGEHGEREHGYFVYEPTVWVPLIIRAPGEFPVKRVDNVVEHVDLVPTVLDALGIAVPESVQGESLLNLMFGGEGNGDGTAYTETFYPRIHFGWSELAAFYHDGMKYVQAPEEELYEFETDAEEQVNLARESSLEARKKDLQERLLSFMDHYSENALDPAATALSREDREALRALGYATTTAGSGNVTARADPKAKIDVFNELNDGTAALRLNDTDRAITAAKDVLGDEPNLLEAHTLLGNAYQKRGNYREAAESFERVLELMPDSNFAMIDLLSALINLGENARAVEKAETFLNRFPHDAVLHEELGVAYFFERSYDKALASLLKSIEIEPSPIALSKVGEIYAIQGDNDTAESYLHRALGMNSRNKGSYYVLAQIEEAKGNLDQAVTYYEKEIDNDPLEYKASFNAAVVLRRQGRYDRAIPFYRKTIEANPRFNVPYFMIANYYFEQDTNIAEAIELCKEGIDVAPEEDSALFGYQVLLRLLEKTGDRASFDSYKRKANDLLQKIEKK